MRYFSVIVFLRMYAHMDTCTQDYPHMHTFMLPTHESVTECPSISGSIELFIRAYSFVTFAYENSAE